MRLGLPSSSAPVAISHVQMQQDSHWVKTRQRNVTSMESTTRILRAKPIKLSA